MLKSVLRALLPGSPVYVRIRSRQLMLRDPTSGRELAIEPTLMVSKNGSSHSYRLQSQPAASGPASLPENPRNGFDHPRSIIADFLIAEKALQLAVAELNKGQRLLPSPIMILHPLEKVEGGLTDVERRALIELGAGAGARKVYVWEGRQLTDPEIQAVGMNDDARFQTDQS